MAMQKFTIAIVGGGIGGLAFAVAVARACDDIDVNIYESTESFGAVGAGIAVWPRVWDSLKTLGLADDLKGKYTSLGDGKLLYRKCDQDEPVDCGAAVQPLKSFHRAEFLKILEDHIPSHYRFHFGKRLVSYEDSAPNPIVLHFKDGTAAECNILIGADGIKSAVRRSMFMDLAAKAGDDTKAAVYRRCIDATWSGVVSYRALVKSEDFKAEHPQHVALSSPVCYFGKMKGVVSYPVSQGCAVNCSAMTFTPGVRDTLYDGPWVTQAAEDEVISHFSGWEPEVCAVLKSMKGVSKWAVNEVRELPTFVSGRVALLGDAAHAMTPHLASGAGQAIEDALMLATILSQPETRQGTLEYALQVFDEIRRPFTQHIQDISLEAGKVLCLENPRMQSYTAEDSAAGRIPRHELMELIAQDVSELQQWTWNTTIKEDLELAIKKLKTNVASS